MAMRANRVPVVSPLMSCWRKISIGAGLVFAQKGLEGELAALHGVAAHGPERRIAVLVERPLAEGAVEVLDREAGAADRVPVLLAGPADRLEGDLAALVAVHGVAFGLLVVL